jgi:L-glutamine:scyllo-inosose aminotransferase
VTERAAYEESVWLHHQVLLGSEKDVDDIVEAIGKIRDNVDELRTAEHRLVELKSMNRADRDRAE